MKHGYYYYLLRYDLDTYKNITPEKFCAALNAEGIPFATGDRLPLYAHPVFDVENLSEHLCPHVLERYRKTVNRKNRRCDAAEEACRCTLLLRHQVLLGDQKDMDDIVTALWKIYKNIEELL